MSTSHKADNSVTPARAQGTLPEMELRECQSYRMQEDQYGILDSRHHLGIALSNSQQLRLSAENLQEMGQCQHLRSFTLIMADWRSREIVTSGESHEHTHKQTNKKT